MTKMVLILSIVATTPLAAVPAFSAAEPAETAALLKNCPGFSAEQIEDPNLPCHEAVRDQYNPSESAGIAFDRNITPSFSPTRDESGGGHVQNGVTPADNTIDNNYGSPFLRSARPSSGSSSGSPSGEESSGTD